MTINNVWKVYLSNDQVLHAFEDFTANMRLLRLTLEKVADDKEALKEKTRRTKARLEHKQYTRRRNGNRK